MGLTGATGITGITGADNTSQLNSLLAQVNQVRIAATQLQILTYWYNQLKYHLPR